MGYMTPPKRGWSGESEMTHGGKALNTKLDYLSLIHRIHARERRTYVCKLSSDFYTFATAMLLPNQQTHK